MTPSRLITVSRWLGLSLSDIQSLCDRRVSRSQIHRILRGRARPTPQERAVLARAMAAALADPVRSDSSFWFCEER